MVTRRRFVIGGSTSIGLLLLQGCRGCNINNGVSNDNSGNENSGNANVSNANASTNANESANPVKVDPERRIVSGIRSRVPRLLLFPDCQKRNRRAPSYCKSKILHVTALEIIEGNEDDHENLVVRVLFSNGQDKRFKGRADSFYKAGRDGKRVIKRDGREGVLLKSVVSSVLDSLFTSMKYSIFKDSFQSIRRDFYSFQEEIQLKSISVGALYLLIAELTGKKTVKHISLSPERRFIVE